MTVTIKMAKIIRMTTRSTNNPIAIQRSKDISLGLEQNQNEDNTVDALSSFNIIGNQYALAKSTLRADGLPL